MTPPLRTRINAKRRHARGWSLTEMIVALAVTGVLLALSSALFTSVRETSREGLCLSRMRSVMQAILLYSVDHDNTVLPWHFNTAAEGQSRRGSSWATVLQREGYLPDLKNRDDARGTLLACPARGAGDLPSAPSRDALHYGYNAYPGFDTAFNQQWADRRLYRLSDIQRPSQTLALGEMNGSYRLYPNTAYDRIYPHRAGMNVFYFDGRGGWIPGPLPVVRRDAVSETFPWW